VNRTDAEKKYGMRIYQGGAVPGKDLRIVRIKGVDAQACGGTHVDNTAEIGLIKIISTERIQDGVVRLEFQVGKNALKNVQRKDEILHELRELWKVSEDKIVETANKFFEEWKQRGRKISDLEEEIVELHFKRVLGPSPKFVGVRTRLTNPGIVQRVFQEKKEKIKDKAVIFFCKDFAVGYSNNDEVNVNLELSKFYKVIKKKDDVYTAFQKK
jgi:alanyl-tRNA synthetase